MKHSALRRGFFSRSAALTLGLFLILGSVFSPLKARAEIGILESLEIDLVIPNAGDSLNSGWAEVDNADLYVEKVEWYREDGSQDDFFKANVSYYADITIVARDEDAGEFVDEDTVITINGSAPVEIDPGDGFLRVRSGLYTFTYPTPGDVALSLVIPEAGDSNSPSASITSGNHCSITDVTWYYTDENGLRNNSFSEFEGGKEYYCWIMISPEDGYRFTGNETVTINGETVSIELMTYMNEDDYSIQAFSKTYTIEKEALPSPGPISIDLTLPKGGDEYNFEVGGSAKVTSGNATVVQVLWYDDAYLGKFDAFKPNTQYIAAIILAPLEGYAFNGTEVITVNGETGDYNLSLEYAEPFAEGGLYVGDIFYKTPQEIKDVAIELTIPKGDDPYDPEKGGEAKVTKGDAEVLQVNWFFGTGDSVGLGNIETFDEDMEYFAEIYLKPINGYVFTGEEKVTINGDEAKVIEKTNYLTDGGLYVCTINYKPDEPEVREIVIDLTVPKGGDRYDPEKGGEAEVTKGKAEVAMVNWFYAEGSSRGLADFEFFEGGIKYFAEIYILPTKNYKFTGNEKFLVNDEEAKTTHATDYYGEGGYYVCTIEIEVPEGEGYKIKFDANGVDVRMPETQVVKDGEKVAVPKRKPEAEGYVFWGWYEDKECENAYDFSKPVSQDMTLYAMWRKIIKRIDVTIAKPEVGMKITDPKLVPTISDKNLIISSVNWDGMFNGSFWMTEDDVFESGRPYRVRLTIAVASMKYCIDENVEVYVNGDKVDLFGGGTSSANFRYDFVMDGEIEESEESSGEASESAESSEESQEQESEVLPGPDGKKKSSASARKIAAIICGSLAGVGILGVAGYFGISALKKKKSKGIDE